MPTQESKYSNFGRFVLESEVDLNSSGAVTATRGTGVTCTKSSTATYTFVFKGNTHSQKLYEILQRVSKINGTPATITTSIVTSVTQATDGSDDITVVVKTTNAAFTETATTGACTLGVILTGRYTRMTNPFD